MNIEALILQAAAIAPALINTGEEIEAAHCNQVVCPTVEIVDAGRKPVVDEATFKTGIETTCGLPLQLGVTNVLQAQARNLT